MRVLLLSTYEMGHQPLHLAGPAGLLRARGHEVRALDLSVESWGQDGVDLEWPEVVAISVPMHTAMRLAGELTARIHATRPEVPIACFGLYAAMARDLPGVGAMFSGEYDEALVAWVEAPGRREWSSSDRVVPGRPDRSGLPALDRYAHLALGGEHRTVGYVEASRGCRHECAHCPIPVVYGGRFWPVPLEVVVDDIDTLVEQGAGHITFGDPDFFNGPAHSMRVLRAARSRHPGLTFDVTVKVEHILRYRHLLPDLAANGTLFVVSAFESTSDYTLRLLAKGHNRADMAAAVGLVQNAGMTIRPTWLPFTPITKPRDVVGIFRFLDAHDLFDVTDPVQLSIRLLVPAGSLVLEVPEFARHIGPYDPRVLGHVWTAADPRTDALQERLAAMAAAQADTNSDPVETLVEMWAAALEVAGEDVAEAQIPAGAVDGRPRLTEPWFC